MHPAESRRDATMSTGRQRGSVAARRAERVRKLRKAVVAGLAGWMQMAEIAPRKSACGKTALRIAAVARLRGRRHAAPGDRIGSPRAMIAGDASAPGFACRARAVPGRNIRRAAEEKSAGGIGPAIVAAVVGIGDRRQHGGAAARRRSAATRASAGPNKRECELPASREDAAPTATRRPRVPRSARECAARRQRDRPRAHAPHRRLGPA